MPATTVGSPNCWKPSTVETPQTMAASAPSRIIVGDARNGRGISGASRRSSQTAMLGMPMPMR